MPGCVDQSLLRGSTELAEVRSSRFGCEGRTACHSGLPGRPAPAFVAGLALAILGAGCGGVAGGRGRVRASSDTALALAMGYDRPRIVRIELGETYPEVAWRRVREIARQVGHEQLDEVKVWDWALLDQIAAQRAGKRGPAAAKPKKLREPPKTRPKPKPRKEPRRGGRRRPKPPEKLGEPVAEKVEPEGPAGAEKAEVPQETEQKAEEKAEGRSEEPEEPKKEPKEEPKRRRGRRRRR